MKHNGSKVILVDLDDTLNNLCSVWIDKLNELYGGNYTTADVVDWDIGKIYPTIPKQEKLEVLSKYNFWKKVKPLDGAQEYLKKLQDEGYDIFIVTATDYRNVKAKVELVINKYFPFIDTHHIIITYYKSLLNGDILIDDYKPNLVYGNYKKILFTTHHNMSDEDVYPKNDVYRADNWEECYKLINVLLGEQND